MSNWLSPEKIRAAAEIHHKLDPGYRDAVIESFLDKVGREIDARVDTRLAHQQAAQPPTRKRRGPPGSPMTLAITSVALGIPFSAIAIAAGKHPASAHAVIVVWTAIINIACTLGYLGRFHQPPERR